MGAPQRMQVRALADMRLLQSLQGSRFIDILLSSANSDVVAFYIRGTD